MEYNFETSGKRIKFLRKSKGWSQEELAEQLSYIDVPITRGRIGSIEKGNQQKFDLPFLLGCCRLFDCDIGYLLGEYNEGTTRDNQFIAQETGLGDAAIRRLSAEKEHYGQFQIDQLSKLILNDTFWEILKLFHRDDSFFENHTRIKKNLADRGWARTLEGQDPEGDEQYNRASRIVYRDEMNYELDKYDALVLFRHIVNEFLPPIK